MTESFKTMDNSMIRNLMKSQSGVEMSDDDIQKMKGFMTPDMLQSMSKMDMDQMKNMGGGFPKSTGSTTTAATKTGGSAPTLPPGTPNINDMMAGGGMPNISGDFVKNMVDMMGDNPEMLKSMANMLGDNPLANMIKNKSPEELKKWMKWIKKLVNVGLFFSPVYKVLKKYWQLLAGLLVGYILYRLL
jgi:hypothetical protein